MTLSLVDKRAEIDQEIIDHLEATLALAREGKIRDLIIGYTQTNLEFFTISSYTNFVTVVGLANILQHDLLHGGDVEMD